MTPSTSNMVRLSTAAVIVLHVVVSARAETTTNANEVNHDKWMEPIRRLSSENFMTHCQRLFMSPQRMLRNEYLSSQFADEVGDMCESFNMVDDCPPHQFHSIPEVLQSGFFSQACRHLGIKADCPVHSLVTMGDTGYLYTPSSAMEIDAMRTDLCIQIGTAFGNYVMPTIEDNVSKEEPGQDSFNPRDPINTVPRPLPDVLAPTSPPTTVETVSPTNKVQHDLNDEDLFHGNHGNNDTPNTSTSDAEALSVGAIIGIAIAVVVLLAIFFFYEHRRHRRLARQVAVLAESNGSHAGGNDKATVDEEQSTIGFKSLPPPESPKRKKNKKKSSTSRLGIEPATPIDEIKYAIDNTDWDNVYRLASKLAETDDALTLPNFDPNIKRDHLNEEDQERTKTLDELMSKGDWTGLAVTAALYAGESGSSSGSSRRKSRSVPPTDAFDLSLAVVPSTKKNRGSQRLSLSAGKKTTDDQAMSDVPIRLNNGDDVDLEKGEQTDIDGLVTNLGAALKAGDWSQVSYYANKIKDEKGATGSSSFGSSEIDSKALVLAGQPSSPSSPGRGKVSMTKSFESTDSDMSRKLTIEKLIKANKWKGVSIMANLYEMESTQTKSVVKSKQHSPRGSRTSALRHDDRVEEESNLVDFRRDADDKPEVPYL